MKKNLCFGLKKSKTDPIDRLVSFQFDKHEKIEYPDYFSLKDQVKQVYDQQDINACSANAAANFVSLSDHNQLIKCSISRLFLYFTTRWLDNDKKLPVEDNGATLKNLMKSITDYHYIDEVKYPYITSKVNDIPNQQVFTEAISVNKCPISSYRQIIPTIESIKYILFKLKLPILFGISVYDNFFI